MPPVILYCEGAFNFQGFENLKTTKTFMFILTSVICYFYITVKFGCEKNYTILRSGALEKDCLEVFTPSSIFFVELVHNASLIVYRLLVPDNTV